MSVTHRNTSVARRTIVSVLVILLILAGSAAGFMGLVARRPDVDTESVPVPPLNVDTFHTQSVNYREILTGWGTARADRQVIVAAQVSGEIISVAPELEVGTSVTAPAVVSGAGPTRMLTGDVLLQLDQRDYQNRVEQALRRRNEATREIERLRQERTNAERLLEKSQQDVVPFQKEYDRFLKAVNRQAGSETSLNRALMELQQQKDAVLRLENQLSLFPVRISSAEERLATSLADLQRANDDLSRTTIRPPFSGLVSEVMAERGQYVRTGEPLFRLTDPDHIEIPVSIPLHDWRQLEHQLQQGRVPNVELSVGEADPVSWSGQLRRVAPEVDPGSRTVLVYIDVDNTQQKSRLLPGTFVHAAISGANSNDAVIVPRSAILDDHVYVVTDGQTERRRIQQGRHLKSLVVVEDGVVAGDDIATTNLTLLESGRRVAIQETATLNDELASQRSPVLQLLDRSTEPPAADADSAATDSGEQDVVPVPDPS